MNCTEGLIPSPEVAMSCSEKQEVVLVKRETTARAQAYLLRLLQFGALEGALGEMDISPVLKPVFEVMHHVLAGGQVEITLVEAGDPRVVQDLNTRLQRAIEATNAINQQAGYSLLLAT